MKEQIKYLDSLNLHLIQDVDILNIYSSPTIIELETKFFRVRVTQHFYGLLTKFHIQHYEFKRIGYYEYEYNKNVKKSLSLTLPKFKVKDILKFIEVKISTFNTLKKIKEMECDNRKYEKELSEDEILLIFDITRITINNFYSKIYDNLKKFLDYLMVNYFLNNTGDCIIWEYRVTDYGINYKGSIFKYNSETMLLEPTSYIYVDLTYNKDYFQLGLFDNDYVVFKIIYSNKNYDISSYSHTSLPKSNGSLYNPLEKDYIFTVDKFTGKVKFKIKDMNQSDYLKFILKRDEYKYSTIYNFHFAPVLEVSVSSPIYNSKDESFFKIIGNFKLWRNDLNFIGNYDYGKDYGNKFDEMIHRNNIRIESQIESVEYISNIN